MKLAYHKKWLSAQKERNLEDYDIEGIFTFKAENPEKKLPTEMKFTPQFFSHSLAYFSREVVLYDAESRVFTPSGYIARTCSKVSATETLKRMPELAKSLVRLFYKINRGELIKGTMVKNPEYSTAVPLVMAGFKLYDDVGYDMWDREDENLNFFLGSTLCTLLNLEDWKPPEDMDIMGERVVQQTAKGTGELSSATSYKMLQPDWIPKRLNRAFIARMVLQTWVFHASLRTNLMILDPVNWDNVPDSEDIVVEDILKPSLGRVWADLPF